MIRSHDTPGNPLQPRGWALPAYTNVAVQARQEAERERRRVAQLTRRCRRLRSVAAWSLAISVVGMAAAFALGGLLGYAFGVGLLGWVPR